MKITQSSLHSEAMTLAYESTVQRTETNISITYPDPAPVTNDASTRSDISPAGLAAQQADAVTTRDKEGDTTDPRLRLLIAIIEALTGRRVELFNGADLIESRSATATPDSGPTADTEPTWSVRIASTRVHEEAEVASYSASGQVSTADGRQIDFALDLTMARYERQESSALFEASSPPKPTDPLVLNLATDQVRLRAEVFRFDLNADGKTDNLAKLAAGSAFLALDRNNNGKIDDGKELFGPSSGDGFAELAALDGDGNGWIDESDAAFSQLKVWRPDEQAQSLKSANVGAIALDHVGTAFSLKAANQLAGAIRSSGLFLSEDGQAKSLQQIDLVV